MSPDDSIKIYDEVLGTKGDVIFQGCGLDGNIGVDKYQKPNLISIGDRVVRGPSWSWGSEVGSIEYILFLLILFDRMVDLGASVKSFKFHLGKVSLVLGFQSLGRILIILGFIVGITKGCVI